MFQSVDFVKSMRKAMALKSAAYLTVAASHLRQLPTIQPNDLPVTRC